MNELRSPDKLRDFLLDKLPAAETDALEQGLVADHEFFAALQESEDDLMDDFVLGALTPDETQRFQEFCGLRPEMPARIAARRAFFAALQGSSVQPRPVRRTRALFARFGIPALGLTCAAMLAIIGALWHANRDLSRKIAGLNAEKLSPPAVLAPANPTLSQASHIATLFFPLNATRGFAPKSPLRLRLDSTSVVALEVATPPELPGPWVVSIADARGAGTAQSGIGTQHIGSVSFVRVYLDPSILHPGAYNVTLSSEPDRRAIQSWQLLATR